MDADDHRFMHEHLIADLKTLRQNGIKLDLLINATCYGEKAFTIEWRQTIEQSLAKLETNGVLPNAVTTTSPFVAKIIKQVYPKIDIRGSVNLKIGSTLAMEYVADTYDSFYMNRDLQRDLPTVKKFSKWCKDHGKKLCMLVNSGCLRNCPSQVFHETLLAHGFWQQKDDARRMGLTTTLCRSIIMDSARYEEILRQTWIRPEDLALYEPYVELFKLSTREWTLDADVILHAYTSGKFRGNLLSIIDPNFSDSLFPYYIDNSAFPSDWGSSGIAGLCAVNCTHCGKCTKVFEQVWKKKEFKANNISFNMPALNMGNFKLK